MPSRSTLQNDERLDRVFESLQQVNVTLEGVRVTLAALVELSGDHELRLRKLERWRNHLTPILAALTFVLGAVVTDTIQRIH